VSLLLADLPNPLNPIGDALGGVASSAAKSAFEFFMSKFAEMLADAAKKVSDELVHYLGTSTGVNLDSGWFAGPRAKDILAVVGTTAGVLLLLFLLFAVIQGLLQGDVTMMLRSAFLEVPISVFGMLVLFVGTGVLLGITDALSTAVLATAPESLARFFVGFTKGPQIMSLGFVGFLGVFLFILTSILLYIELVVRASLIYLLLAAAPLGLAVRVWPQMRGVWHSFLRLGVSLIVSKFIVALALGLGAAALGGGGPKDGDFGTQAGLTVQGVIVGVTLMSLAAFAPFVVLKLIPVLEAALIAQGISRGPLRAAQTGMQGAYYARGLQRLAGGPGDSGGGQGGGGSANGSRPGPGGGPQGGSPTGGGGGPTAAAGLGRGGGVGAAGAGGAAGGGATGGSATAGGGAAAAGPAAAAAAAVMMPVGAAKALAGKAANTTTQAKPES
jgi:hypothetical protein